MQVSSELSTNPINIYSFNNQEKPINKIQPDPAESAIAEPSKPQATESLYAGKISLNLYYSRTEFTEVALHKKNMGESFTVKEQLYKKFEASLSIDVSFIAKFEGVHDRVKEIDSSVLSKWMALTEDLLNLEDSGVEAFIDATDELFNEIETSIGMESDALDDMSFFFKDELNKFISSVKEQVETKRIEDPSKPSEITSTDFIPQLLNEIKSSLKDDLKDFIHLKFEELIRNFLENQKKDFSLLKFEPQSFLDIEKV